MSENNIKQPEEVIAPRKRKALVEYLSILFAVAFLLVAVSLLVKVNSMQEDLDAATSGARENIAAMEGQLESVCQENQELEKALERSEKAGELLALAQDAYYRKDSVTFHGCMAELEGYADILPGAAAELYADLAEHLQ